MRVGFIGLGEQGGAMAEMLLADGHELHVWARRPETAAAFAQRGARSHATARELAGAVQLMCLCVTADADVLEVTEGNGVLSALRPGAVLAVHSTVSPQVCLQLAEQAQPRGVQVLDAPVSGSAVGARERRLLMMTGGDADAAALAATAFAGFCKPIVHMGPLGSALHAKFINNLLMHANLELARAALAAGERFGIDRLVLREAMLAGVARSFALDAIVRQEVPERARHLVGLMQKDQQLANAAAESAGVSLGDLSRLARAAQEHLRRCAAGAPPQPFRASSMQAP